LAALLRRIDNFTAEEVEVALELIDEAIARPESGYRCLVALGLGGEDETLLGYTCFGQTPMTESTYDLYWIVVDAAHRDKGIGHHLLQALYETLTHLGARLIRVETSSMESYRGSLRFYEKEGFTTVGRIPSFYKEGDDLIVMYFRASA